VTEWKLWEGDEPPFFTTTEFFAAHPWISPAHQIGHAERMQMVHAAFQNLYALDPSIKTLTDLGCGDGSFLDLVSYAPVRSWGYDAGVSNVEHARDKGLDVRRADIINDDLLYGDVVTATEVVEHLVDPHTFLRHLPGKYLITTSPSAETDVWHYEHHAWAWDMPGYIKLVEDAGWSIIRHYETWSEKTYDHNTGHFQQLRFQAIVAQRNGDRNVAQAA
jgi:hypothetical protein